jgi:hypothetical protein
MKTREAIQRMEFTILKYTFAVANARKKTHGVEFLRMRIAVKNL